MHLDGNIQGDGRNGGARSSAPPTESAGQTQARHNADVQGDGRNGRVTPSAPTSTSGGHAKGRDDDIQGDSMNDGARPSAPSSLSRGQAQARQDGDVHRDKRKKANVSTQSSVSTAQAKAQHGDIQDDVIDGARPLVPSNAPRGQAQDHNEDIRGNEKNEVARPIAPPPATGEQAQHEDRDIQGARRKETKADHSTKSEEENKASPGMVDDDDGDIHRKGRENYQEGCSNSGAVVIPLKNTSMSALQDDGNDELDLLLGDGEKYNDRESLSMQVLGKEQPVHTPCIKNALMNK